MQHEDKHVFIVTLYPQEDDVLRGTTDQELQGLLENYYEDVRVTEVGA
jgi:hypothetical protein